MAALFRTFFPRFNGARLFRASDYIPEAFRIIIGLEVLDYFTDQGEITQHSHAM